jgi:ABC-2 type transport system ATP-binding protein
MIQIKNLNFAYETPLFRNLNLILAQGKITGLLGHNGAGKSTLLKLICGLMEAPLGSVEVNGFVPRKREMTFLQNIFFVPESCEMIDVVPQKLSQTFGSLYPKFNADQYFSLLAELEVDATSRPSSLSFGQKRKSLLAFGLATNTDVLILDEPSNGFDIQSQVSLRRSLQKYLTPQKSIVISTHHIREFEDILEEIVILNSGAVVLKTSARDLKNDAGKLDLEQVFLQATSKARA